MERIRPEFSALILRAGTEETRISGDTSDAMGTHTTTRRLHWLTAAIAQAEGGPNLGLEEAYEAIPHALDTREAWEAAAKRFSLTEDQIARFVAEAYRMDVATLEDVEREVGALVPVDDDDPVHVVGIVRARVVG